MQLWLSRWVGGDIKFGKIENSAHPTLDPLIPPSSALLSPDQSALIDLTRLSRTTKDWEPWCAWMWFILVFQPYYAPSFSRTIYMTVHGGLIQFCFFHEWHNKLQLILSRDIQFKSTLNFSNLQSYQVTNFGDSQGIASTKAQAFRLVRQKEKKTGSHMHWPAGGWCSFRALPVFAFTYSYS